MRFVKYRIEASGLKLNLVMGNRLLDPEVAIFCTKIRAEAELAILHDATA